MSTKGKTLKQINLTKLLTKANLKDLSKIVIPLILAFALFLYQDFIVDSLPIMPDVTDTISPADQREIGDNTLYEVIRVVDGDTIRIDYNGNDESLRLLTVDTPETIDPSQDPQCYGKEASDYLKSLLPEGTQIYFTSDSIQGERDRFGRLLGYVWLYVENGPDLFINQEEVRLGYARVYTDLKSDKLAEFLILEQEAMSNRVGLWGSACECIYLECMP